ITSAARLARAASATRRTITCPSTGSRSLFSPPIREERPAARMTAATRDFAWLSADDIAAGSTWPPSAARPSLLFLNASQQPGHGRFSRGAQDSPQLLA